MGADTTTGSDWPRIGLLLLCGVFAATQVGKLPPAIPALREAFGASLVQLGWISSVFNLTAAAIGIATGLLADRVGRRRALGFGLVALGAGALLGAVGEGVAVLFASRIVEGLGFVGIVVAVPALLREFAAAKRLRLALGLWSSYMALGMTSMLLAAPLWMQSVGWRGGWWFGAGGAAVLYLCVRTALPVRAISREVSAPALRGLGDPTPWLLGTCFAVYTLQWMAMMVWLPTFLHDDLGFGLAGASAAVAAVIVANAPGNWLGGWLSGRGVAPFVLVLVPALVMGATGALAFAGGLDAAVRLAICIVFSFCGGVLPAAIYAVLPAVAARRRNFGAVNGLAVQASNLGALVGPPLAATMVALGGWRAVALAYVATTTLSVWAILRATRMPELRGIAVEPVRGG
jgi:MFS family permease